MEGIQVSVEQAAAHSGISIIRVGGYIDTTTSSELERALDSLLKAGSYRIIIDLGNVDYISSAGWGIFISEIKGIRERGGDLKLARMIPDVYEVFELLEFHFILKAFPSVEEAIHDFGMKIKKPKSEQEDAAIIDSTEKLQEEAAMEEEDIPERVEDKIKAICLTHPSWGAARISKELNNEEYGFIRVGTLGVWKILRRLNLGSKEQREALTQEKKSG